MPKRLIFQKQTLLLMAVFVCFTHFLRAQSDRTKQLEQDFYRLSNAFRYDSATLYIEQFLGKENLTNDERFYAHLYRSYVFKRLSDYASTMRCLNDALAYGLQTENPAYYEANIAAQRALAYFDISEYAKADSLMQVLKANGYAHLNAEYQAKIFMQEAYLLFLDKKYEAADKLYDLAMDSLKVSSPCDLPMILGKKMQLYAEIGRADMIEPVLQEAIRMADSCQIMKYKIYA